MTGLDIEYRIILTMREVTADSNTWAGTVGDTTLPLVPNALSKIAEPHTSTNLDNIRSLI